MSSGARGYVNESRDARRSLLVALVGASWTTNERVHTVPPSLRNVQIGPVVEHLNDGKDCCSEGVDTDYRMVSNVRDLVDDITSFGWSTEAVIDSCCETWQVAARTLPITNRIHFSSPYDEKASGLCLCGTQRLKHLSHRTGYASSSAFLSVYALACRAMLYKLPKPQRHNRRASLQSCAERFAPGG